MGATGTTGSHETKSSVIRSFLAHPRDVYVLIPDRCTLTYFVVRSLESMIDYTR